VYYPKDKPKKVYGGENPFLDMLKQKYGGQPCYQCGGMYDQGGPILDPRGQWAHPGKVTRIPSDNITMQGVNYPVLGVGSNGQQQMMYPEQEYDFGGASYVDEYPMMQNGGGLLSRTVNCSSCGWSWKAADGGIDPLTCHKCGGVVKMQRGGYLVTAQDGRTIRAANGEFSCAANPRSDLRASAASVSGGSSDPLRDAKNDYWGRIKEDWQAQGVNKESFNNMYEDSLRAGPAFENPLSAQYFDPSTGKARPGTPGRLRYYKEAGYPLGTRPTLEQIKNTALEQPKGVKGYNKLVKDDYPWGVSPYIPTKKNGGRIGYMQGGGLWGTDKVAYLDSTVNANKNLDFIQRAMQDNGMSIPTPKGAPGYGEGKTSSHLMTFDPKSRRAYPELVNMNGSLKYLTGDAAYNYAEDNGEYIQFPTSEQADYFSQNYKKSNYIKVGKQPLEKKHGIKVTYKK
jgi:hypothetical protein